MSTVPILPVKVIWGNGGLEILNSRPEVEDVLTYQHKSMEWDPQLHEKRTRFETVNLFRTADENPRRIISPFPGLVDAVVEACQKSNIPCELADIRPSFAKPDLTQMKGFRPGQLEMFLRMLRAGKSGLLKMPTRSGKSYCILNTIRVFRGLKTVLTAPGVDLLGQLVDHLQRLLPDREVKGIFTGSKGKTESDDITVCSLDSLHKVTAADTELLLVDEPHAAASPERIPELCKFVNARRYGFGATTDGRYDKADTVITGLFGPVLAHMTFQQAVEKGLICNIVVYMVKVPFSGCQARNRDEVYKKLLYQNPRFSDLVCRVSRDVVPKNWQTFIFVDQVKQGETINALIADGVLSVAGQMGKKEREERFQELQRGDHKRCVCTNIYSTGVTFPDIRVLVNACGGGGSITSTQKPGRLAEIRPGKQCGYLVDFLFEDQDHSHEENKACACITRDGYARVQVYKKNGYEIRYVTDLSQIKFD